jgi:fermentation-respiration switch protein FrsA (DUF1100 family)
MKNKLLAIICAILILSGHSVAQPQAKQQKQSTTSIKEIAPKDYKTFTVSDNIAMYEVAFQNQYKLKVVGHLFMPKNLDKNKKYRAIIVGAPMGAVKEQGADVYAARLAESNFVTLAIDLSYWGQSEGSPRNAVSPEMYVEDYMAGVDFLGTRPFVDRDNIGAIGICGSGSFVVSAAKIDTRIKALATVSMYDMGAVTRNGIKKGQTFEQRKAFIAATAKERYTDFEGGNSKWVNYLPVQLPADADSIRREFYDFYRTPRGIHIPEGRTLELTQNRQISSEVKFMNFYPFNDIEMISPRPVLFITGDHSHSREFSEDAYQRAAMPKELLVVPNAGHVDLYDRIEKIPFDKIQEFFDKNLK